MFLTKITILQKNSKINCYNIANLVIRLPEGRNRKSKLLFVPKGDVGQENT